MAGYDNIKDKGFDHRSTEELREIQRKGGVNSGIKRRQKRDLRKCVQMVLNTKAHGEKTKATVKEVMGVDEDDVTNRDVMIARLTLNALAGDLNALRTLFEYSGETASEKRAEKAEKRAAKAFKVQMDNIDNLDKDNDNVMQYIQGMKQNTVKPDTDDIRAEEEAKQKDKGKADEDTSTE